MADGLFEFIASRIQEKTDLDQLEARGTLRIALKEAGLEPRSVTPEQMAVMLEKTMPRELVARGVEDADAVCRDLVTRLKGYRADAVRRAESPEDVFRRLGSR